MTKAPQHLDGLIDLLVEAVLREMEEGPRETAPPAKADAAPGDDERNRHGQDTAIRDDRKRTPLPPDLTVRQLRHPLPPLTS